MIPGLPAVRELLRAGAQLRPRTATEQHIRDELGCEQPHDVRRPRPSYDYDDTRRSGRPLDLDETIRAVICTSDTPEDLVSRVQQAIGEPASASDDLHVSHAIAPDPSSGLMLYSALIVLRPGLGNS